MSILLEISRIELSEQIQATFYMNLYLTSSYLKQFLNNAV